jgi:hypothetical protein
MAKIVTADVEADILYDIKNKIAQRH